MDFLSGAWWPRISCLIVIFLNLLTSVTCLSSVLYINFRTYMIAGIKETNKEIYLKVMEENPDNMELQKSLESSQDKFQIQQESNSGSQREPSEFFPRSSSFPK